MQPIKIMCNLCVIVENKFCLFYHEAQVLEYVLRKPFYCPRRSNTSHKIMPHDAEAQKRWVLKTRTREKRKTCHQAST